MKKCLVACSLTLGLAALARGDIVASSANHYSLRQEGHSSLPPEVLWERLVHPELWWSPAHTYSGDAANLSLDLRPGGLWLERWERGATAHGVVLSVHEGRQLRIDAPFGPLQSLAVSVVWTITIVPEAQGSRVIFEEVANGTEASELSAIAASVDGVKTEALSRLVAPE